MAPCSAARWRGVWPFLKLAAFRLMSTPSSVRSSFSRAVSLLRTARWMGARPEPSPSTSCLAPTRRSCAMNSAFRSSIAVSSRLRRKDVRRKLDPMPTYFAPPSAAGRFIQCATSSSPSSTSPTLIMSVKLLRSPACRNMRAAACCSDMQLRLVILMHSAPASNFPVLAIFTTFVAQFQVIKHLVISHGGHVHCLLSPRTGTSLPGAGPLLITESRLHCKFSLCKFMSHGGTRLQQ